MGPIFLVEVGGSMSLFEVYEAMPWALPVNLTISAGLAVLAYWLSTGALVRRPRAS